MKFLYKTTTGNLKANVNKVNDFYFSKDTIKFWSSSIKNVYTNKNNNMFLVHEKTIMPSGKPYYFIKVMFIINSKLEVKDFDCSWSEALSFFQSLGLREQESINNAKNFDNTWNESSKEWITSIGNNCDIVLTRIGKNDRVIVG